MLGADRFEVSVEFVDVAFVAQKRHGQHVSVHSGDFEERKIGVTHRGGGQVGVRKVDPLLGA